MHDHDLKCACSWFSLFLLYIIVCPKAKKKNMIQFLWNDLKLSFGVDSILNYYKRHIDRRTIERSLRKTKEKPKKHSPPSATFTTWLWYKIYTWKNKNKKLNFNFGFLFFKKKETISGKNFTIHFIFHAYI